MRPAIFTLFFSLLLLLDATTVRGQYFGQNKTAYDRFPFVVKESPHLELYHYTTDSAADTYLRWAEQWYAMHQELLKDTIAYKNPIVLYNNHADFQQTTAISGGIGVGTGGVTEGLKNRVVMPFMETHGQTNHVLGHELVHAFQYDILKSTDSISLANIQNLPLWFVEGMAEYLSIGRDDPNTSMWMRDAVMSGDFPTIKDLNRSSKYFPYRYGQAFWGFVTGVWGDKVVQPLFVNTAKFGLEYAVDSVLRVDTDSLSKMWKQATFNHYDTASLLSMEKPVGRELVNKENGGRMNISPSVSPDGRYVVFMSEKDVLTTDLYLAEVGSGKVLRKIASTSRAGHIDDFNYLESSGTWSPDGRRFAFTAFSKGETKVIIKNPFTGKTEDEFFVGGVPFLTQPSWSPDGRTIAFVGLVNGVSDIFTVDVKTREVAQLTSDWYSDIQPSWSPDGQRIIFASDRNSWINGRHEGKMNISVVDINTGHVESMPFFEWANNLNPVFTNDSTFLFLSDQDGYRNLYGYNPTSGELSRLTDYATGITGITPYSPALSFSGATNMLYYSLYQKGAYLLMEGPLAEFTFREVGIAEGPGLPGMLPPAPDPEGDGIPARLAAFFSGAVLPADSIVTTPYKPKFQLDYIGNTGAGMSTSNFGTALAGGVNMLFSDILGYNQLFTGVAVNGEIYDVGGVVGFLNQKRQLNWGGSFSHIPYQSGRVSVVPDSIDIRGETYQVTNVRYDLLRTFEDRASAFAFLPLNRANRFEGSYSVARYAFRLDRYNNYYNQLFYKLHQKRERLDGAPDSYFINNVNVAYVHDNAVAGLVGPLDGARYRIQADQYFGEVNYQALLVDMRKYFRLAPFTIGWRGYHYGRYGGDAESERLYPLSVSYPYLVHGYHNLSYQSYEPGSGGDLTINDLVGSRIFVSNVELRFPFSGPERLSLIKSRIFLSELALFADGGYAWSSPGYYHGPGESASGQATGFFDGGRKPVFSAGVALRVNLFGQLVLEPYYAIPFQRNDVNAGVFGLNFVPAW